ncbi:hypothetical protein PQX77_004315 [Marasmius sp. AFHP31]|nr:hypothetical protein PQX77_004315 [Marasmius sp. AFHP31]
MFGLKTPTKFDLPTKNSGWKRDSYKRIAYFITSPVAFPDIAGGAIKCYFDYKNLPFETRNLCPVLDESLDSSDGVFGDKGKLFSEVNSGTPLAVIGRDAKQVNQTCGGPFFDTFTTER